MIPQISPTERLHRAANPEPRRFVQPSFEMGYSNPFWRPDEQLSEPTPEAASETGEATTESLPPLIVPPERDLAKEASDLLSPVRTYLSQLEVASEFAEQRNDLFSQLEGFTQSLTTLLSGDRKARIARLTTEHEQAAEACRQQSVILDGALVELNQFTARLRTAKAETGKARAAFLAWEDNKPRLESWPTREQMAAWEKDMNARREALRLAEQAEAAVIEAGSAVRARAAEAKRRLAELESAEEILRTKLSGSAWRSAEFGLMNPPEV